MRSAAMFRHEMRLVRSELLGMTQLILMPLVMMAFLIPLSKQGLLSQGFEGANGSEQVVPGMTVMFTMFMSGQVSFLFFREHGYGTWERLRASVLRPLDIVAGKVGVPLLMVVAQQAILFAIGAVLFGFRVRGALVALPLIMVGYGISLCAIGGLLAAVCKSNQQINLVSNVVAMAMSGMGGAFVPLDALPGWAQSIAPITPTYWTMTAYRAVVLDGAGILGVLRPVGVLLAMGLGLAALAMTRFRFEETKIVVG